MPQRFTDHTLIIKYFMLGALSFFLTIFPLFNFQGLLIDYDYSWLVDLNLKGLFEQYEVHGFYRIINLTVLFVASKVFSLIPVHSYFVILIFYISYFVLCEKILSLLKFPENTRLFIFFFSTSFILALPTVFLWSRTLNEFIAIIISWFFVKKIIESTNDTKKLFFVLIWGLVSLASYELFFPFLLTVLISRGLIRSFALFFAGLITFPAMLLVLPFNMQKTTFSISSFWNSMSNLVYYIKLKLSEILYTLTFFSPELIFIPIVIMILVISFYIFEISKTLSLTHQSPNLNIFIIVGSLGVLLAFFILDKNSSKDMISINGKLSWNVLNGFWFCLVLFLLTIKAKTFMRIILFFFPLAGSFISAILSRIFGKEITYSKLAKPKEGLIQNIDLSIFKNFPDLPF